MLRSVANLIRRDAQEFLSLSPQVPVRTEIRTRPLSQANQALEDLGRGRLQGAAVLIPDGFSWPRSAGPGRLRDVQAVISGHVLSP